MINGGYVKIPASPDTHCPKCGESNPDERNVRVWHVADERGAHFECDTCATDWKTPVAAAPASARA